MEEFVKTIALELSTFIELIAAVVIAVALVQFIFNYVKSLFKLSDHIDNAWLKVKFGGFAGNCP
jgi:hypothetical protein